MTLDEMKAYLAAHGVEDGSFYSHGGLGGGEIDGIEEVDGVWHTYFSERGGKNDRRAWPSEEAAVASILDGIVAHARRVGAWRDTGTTPREEQ